MDFQLLKTICLDDFLNGDNNFNSIIKYFMGYQKKYELDIEYCLG